HVVLGFRARPSGDLVFVESAEVVRAPRNLSRDLDRYAYSTYALELVDCLVEGREAEAPLFDLSEEMLCRIDDLATPPAAEWLRRFEVRLLALVGLEPRLESC